MALARLVWGGTMRDSNVDGANIIDIWSCSLSLLTGFHDNAAMQAACDDFAGYLMAFHAAADTKISSACWLEWVKLNLVEIDTGEQANDPTIMTEISPVEKGGSSNAVPTFISLKVTLDDGTRDRTTKGGFFVPRFAAVVQNTGRYSESVVSDLRGSVDTLIDAINTHADGWDVGIWSRRNASITKSTRLRVGDVPDYISRRKNELREHYQTSEITT